MTFIPLIIMNTAQILIPNRCRALFILFSVGRRNLSLNRFEDFTEIA